MPGSVIRSVLDHDIDRDLAGAGESKGEREAVLERQWTLEAADADVPAARPERHRPTRQQFEIFERRAVLIAQNHLAGDRRLAADETFGAAAGVAEREKHRGSAGHRRTRPGMADLDRTEAIGMR